MIIRRRTYIRQFTGQYGFFMRNVNLRFGTIEDTNRTTGKVTTYAVDQLCNIYTKCMLKEAPIGSFPVATRKADYCTTSGYNKITCTMGYTDGHTIIVATGKKLYRSTNNGGTWTELCTWNTATYISRLFGPVVWMDSNYYYVVYVSLDNPGYESGYYRLKIFKYAINSGATTTSTIDSLYYTAGSSGFSPYSVEYTSTFYGSKVSPKGLIMIYKTASSTSVTWIILDIPRGIKSGDITANGTGYGAFPMLGFAGLWYNDGSTYGKFHFTCSNTIYSNGSTGYCEKYDYYTATASLFSSGGSITKTNIESALGTLLTDNLLYYPEYHTYSGQIQYYPAFHIASCDPSYKNKLLLFLIRGNIANYRVYVCNANFSNPQLLTTPNNLEEIVTNVNYSHPRLCGVSVTPDGKYGCLHYGEGTAVFDLDTNKFWGGYCLTASEGIIPYTTDYASFMLPLIPI